MISNIFMVIWIKKEIFRYLTEVVKPARTIKGYSIGVHVNIIGLLTYKDTIFTKNDFLDTTFNELKNKCADIAKNIAIEEIRNRPWIFENSKVEKLKSDLMMLGLIEKQIFKRDNGTSSNKYSRFSFGSDIIERLESTKKLHKFRYWLTQNNLLTDTLPYYFDSEPVKEE